MVVFFLARSGKVSATRLLDLGLVFQVVVALAIAISFVPATWFHATRTGVAWSPIAVWVIIYPIIVPNTTRHTLIASFLAASTEPLTMLVMSRAGYGTLLEANVFVTSVSTGCSSM